MRRLLALIALVTIGATGVSNPGFSQSDGWVLEGYSYTPTVVKSAVAKSYSKITFTVLPGTCPSSRYTTPAPLTVTVSNSQITAKGPVIQTTPNTVIDGSCTILVRITAVRNASILRSVATVTIKDDDVAPAPPPATQTCPDGSTIPATSTCPAPPPVVVTPPIYTSWVPAPLTVGGFACNKNQSGHGNVPPCGSGIVMRVVGTVPSEAGSSSSQIFYAAQFYQDASGQFPVTSAYHTTVVSYWSAEDLQGIAPSGSVS